MASAVPDRQIIGLDAIRFAAAILVMLFHLAFASWANPRSAVSDIVGGAAAFPGLASFTWFGWIGVEIFFVLSGIVICLSAERSTAFGFARSRIVRLYPGAWLCGTLTLAVLLPLGQSDLGVRYARTMLLFPSGPWLADVYWTLAHELTFYAAVFLLLLAGGLRHLGRLLAVLGIVSSAYWLLVAVDGNGSLGPSAHAWLLLGLRLPARLVLGFGCFFALGGFICLSVRDRCGAARLGLIALCATGSLIRIVWRAESLGQSLGMALDPLVPALVWAAATALMAASLAWNEPIGRTLRGVAAPLREAGLATYPLYLLHAPIGAALLLGLSNAGLSGGVALGGAIAAVLALSFAVSLWLERPAQALLRRALVAAARFGEPKQRTSTK